MQEPPLEDPDRKINLDRGKGQKETHGDEAEGQLSQAEQNKNARIREAKNFIRGAGSYHGHPSLPAGGSGKAVDSCFPLLSGRNFEIQMPTQDAQNMKIMLDF